ncbi:MAG: hypothetical protein EAZ92_06325 [Candidatus Kapaibacterium sp.]|nr:MAG: hypothetical protein EAZ92_06325 [Candidatus Kapabacteria bacterium]
MKACVARCRAYASRVFPADLFARIFSLRILFSRSLFSRPLQAVSMLAIACLLLSAQCRFPTATPGLLNTPLTYSTIQIRFLNLAADKQPRLMQISGSSAGFFPVRPPIPFAELSDTIAPRGDSARARVALIMGIMGKDTTEYTGTTTATRPAIRFAGVNSVYTLIALPSRRGTGSGQTETKATMTMGSSAVDVFLPNLQPARPVDTVLALGWFTGAQSAGAVRIRAVNCIADTLVTFDLTLGCPSGDAVATSLPYLGISPYRTQNLPGGLNDTVTVSLITRIGQSRTTTGQSVPTPPIINGSFGLSVRSGQSYAVLIYRDNDGKISLLPINEQSGETVSFRTQSDIKTNVRVVNMSGSVIERLAVGDSTQSTPLDLSTSGMNTGMELPPLKTTGYKPLSACRSIGRDVVQMKFASTLPAIDTTTLAAGQDYTMIAGRNDARSLGRTIVARVENTTVLSSDSAYIRIVSFLNEPVQVQRGLSHQSPQQILTGTMAFGTMSPRLTVKAGTTNPYLPLLVFSAPPPPSLAPQILLQTGLAGIQGQRSYFIILMRSSSTGPVEMYVLEDTKTPPANVVLSQMDKGAFVQFVNARTTSYVLKRATNTTPPMSIDDVQLFYGRPQMSVLRTGTYAFNMERNTNGGSFGVKPGERRVLVFWENKDGALQMLVDTGMKDDARWRTLGLFGVNPDRDDRNIQPLFRYMNVSSDFGRMFVDPNPDGGDFKLSSTGSVNYRAIAPGEASFPKPFVAARTYDLRFRRFENPADSMSVLLRDYSFGANRAYTIIFSGKTITPRRGDTAAVQTYNTVVLQEF